MGGGGVVGWMTCLKNTSITCFVNFIKSKYVAYNVRTFNFVQQPI